MKTLQNSFHRFFCFLPSSGGYMYSGYVVFPDMTLCLEPRRLISPSLVLSDDMVKMEMCFSCSRSLTA